MKQPDLGITIAELRVQKGFTQEKLAEYCEVSSRTIQRIENGEVEPRAFTLNNLSNILEFDFNGKDDQADTTWLTALHLSCALPIGMVIIPLFIWSRKKKQNYKINQQGRAVLNFQITIMLILLAALIFFVITLATVMIIDERGRATDLTFTTLFAIGVLPFGIVTTYSIFQGVINATRMLSDKPIHYRLSIPFVK